MFATAEHAATFTGRRQSPFEGLARQSGFSVRECQVAAATGRLVDLVKIAEQRRSPRAEQARRVQRRLLELRARMAEVEGR